MSDKQDIHEALKAAGAPDYMVLIITKIMSAEDANREMMAMLSARSVELNQREQVFDQRMIAFVDASHDMMAFANRIYGPDSELTKINHKLDQLEASSSKRDAHHARSFESVNESQAHFKESVDSRLKEISDRVHVLERRVGDLEKAV